MALVVPNASEVLMLEYILNKTAPQDLTVRLYDNDITPDESTTELTLNEVAGNGYAPKILTAANWDITPGNPSEAVYNVEQVFTFTGAAGNIYGYYVTRTGGELMWAERFTGGPFDVQVAGSEIRITLRFTAE
jgi:hypothetical protein